MRQWNAPSELWLQRMIEALEQQIVAIGVVPPAETRWRGRIPVVPLEDQPALRWRRLVQRAGINVRLKPRKTVLEVLSDAVSQPAVTHVLAHYLDFALKFQPVWADTTKPLFVHCHGYDVTWDLRKPENPANPRFGPDYIPAVRRLSERATLIANSQATARRLEEIGIARERIVRKSFGVPVPDDPPHRPPRTQGVEILYLGRLVDFKGPDLVIQAFERACDHGLDGRLTIAGDGPLRVTCELMRVQSRYAERIRMLGAVDAQTAMQLRGRADIFTAHNWLGPLTRQEEAFGVSIVEAMADALPVISGASGSLPETVVSGETGILVPPGDVDAHAKALVELGRDPERRRRMGEAAWRRAKSLYSVEMERKQLLKILGIAPNA